MSEQEDKSSAIQVVITDESTLHCLKIVFQSKNVEQPLEIFLHTTQAIHLVHKLSLAICELHHRDSALLLKLASDPETGEPILETFPNATTEIVEEEEEP
jgi:hypothetical protein